MGLDFRPIKDYYLVGWSHAQGGRMTSTRREGGSMQKGWMEKITKMMMEQCIVFGWTDTQTKRPDMEKVLLTIQISANAILKIFTSTKNYCGNYCSSTSNMQNT